MSAIQAGANMAFSVPRLFNNNMDGGIIAYPTISGNVRVDQMKPLVLGQLNFFRLNASEAGKGTLDLSVGPPGSSLPHDIRNVGTQLFMVEFTPMEPVDHEVSIQFNEVHIPGSPFILKAPYMDISSVIVSGEGLVMAQVYQQSHFNINASRMPPTVQPVVTVAAPHGFIQANIISTDQSQYRVCWVPNHSGDHEVQVTMAGQEVPRSPFRVKVTDPRQVHVDCPSFANLGNAANVKVDVSRAGLGKLVVIISVDGINVPNTVHQDGPSLYRFSFKPNIAKPHDITVQFNGEDVSGSPFTCTVTGGSRNVVLSDHQTSPHYCASPVEIEIDARSAGEGQIVAEVRSLTDGGGVPSDLVPTSVKKVYLLSFVPKEGGEHTVTVTFNDEPIPQSPLKVNVHGGPIQQDKISNMQRTESSVYQQTPSLSPPSSQQQLVQETVYTEQQEIAPAPSPLPQVVREQSLYSSQQSPQTIQSYDLQHAAMTQQRELTRTITYQPQYESAMANEKTYFEINPHGLPQKEIDVRLEDPYDNPVSLTTSREGDRYRYEFTPRHTGKYQVYVDIDETPLPGSPFIYFVQPSSGVTVTDITEEGDIGEEMYFIVDASAAGSGDLDVEVSCNGQIVRIKREPLGQSQYRYTYIPRQGGEHLIDVQYNYERVPGCPIRTHVNETQRSMDRTTSSVYGVQGVSGRGIHSTPVSQQAYFIIDMHGRNWQLSDIEVDVRGFKYVTADCFSPAKADPGGVKHASSAGYDTDDSVFDRDKTSLGHAEDNGAPNGLSVPCKLFLESSNEIRVEYETPYVGRHLVDIYCKGKRVAGSPYTVEVFDPKKVGLESMAKESYLHEETEFEVLDDSHVINDEAGSADMECRVISPSGRIIPSQVVNTERGMKVKYTPEESGVYYVHTYIGGVEIPGSPMTQVVRAHTLGSKHSGTSHHEYTSQKKVDQLQDDGFGKITVSGDGLYTAEEDKPAHFYIDTHGMEGTPEVRVEGPHSVAKCSVAPEGAYRFKVTYIPVETGVYDIYVKWYNQEIDGSPFHPRVVDARKVRAKGDWQSKLDTEQRVALEVGKMKRLVFDVTEAGPGDLKAEVRHVASGRQVPVTISEKDAYHYLVDFVPDQVGDYLISINWTDTPIPNSPIRGYATEAIKLKAEVQATGQTASGGKSGKEFSSTTTKKVIKSGGGGGSAFDHSKVVLSGTGLKEGIAGHVAEFYIDGSKAADGEPTVILKNSRLQHIPVELVRHSSKCYKCTYTVNEPGAHLLFVSWGERDLLNSPYTVSVRSGAHDAAKSLNAGAAAVTGEGNKYKTSGYNTHQRTAATTSSHQKHKEQTISIDDDAAADPHSSAAVGLSGSQSGMSKHFVRKAKMTTSGSQQQSQNVGENFQLMIDANMVAGGELVARCLGPSVNAKCELVKKEGGSYALNVRPQEPGEHNLSVTYKDEHIEGSPFIFTVQGPAPPDPSRVIVRGPGVLHGILPNFESKFYVDTEGAGAGNLSVKMRGPKGGFQATMRRVSQASRTIECTYNPAEVGLYVIHIKWSDVDVPGSPFHVHIFDTHYELDRFTKTGELPTTLREHHLLQIRDPTQSYQTSAYQTNTLRTQKKNKKTKKNKHGLKREPVTLIQTPVQAVQPVQYVVRESQYHPQPQFVHVKETGDPNYVEAASGRPVQLVNGGAVGEHQNSSYYREGHYNSGGGGRTVDGYGPASFAHGSKAKFVVPDNAPQYVVRR